MLKFPFVLHRLAGSKHQFSPSLHSTELQRHDGTLGELAAVPLVFAHFLILVLEQIWCASWASALHIKPELSVQITSLPLVAEHIHGIRVVGD